MASWIGALFILFVYFVGSMLATVLIRAAVLQIMWGWFVVPQFGLEPLSFAMAAGLIATALIIQGMSESVGSGWKVWRSEDNARKNSSAGDGSDTDESWDERSQRMKQSLIALSLTHIIMPLTILALGWLLKQML